MMGRLPVSTLGTDRHGALDARSLETDGVRAATARYDAAVHALEALDAVTTELVRIRNAYRQQCHL